jgi:hypothetical protein
MSKGDHAMKYDAPKGFPWLVIDSRTNTVAAAYSDPEAAVEQAAKLNYGDPGRYEAVEQPE